MIFESRKGAENLYTTASLSSLLVCMEYLLYQPFTLWLISSFPNLVPTRITCVFEKVHQQNIYPDSWHLLLPSPTGLKIRESFRHEPCDGLQTTLESYENPQKN